MKKLYLLFLFILFTSSLHAQKIKGFITTNEGNTLFTGNVLFKEANKPTSIKEFVIAKNGNYSYTFKKDYDTLLIEVRSMGYLSQTKLIFTPQKNKTYTVDFVMPIDTTQLKEITIEGSRRFEQKGDTLIYEADAFKDGSERKVEDLLKKLPGVEVDDNTGAIKYKGKAVETVTLDGDNLFGQNYTLGTRNINVDMVEQVEAIENYNENHLLKDVDNGEKVALNLKLKKGKVDLSGNIDIETGAFDTDRLAANLNTNILSITKGYKSFSTLSYNNVGSNRSPFDYFAFSLNAEQLSERDWYAKKIIPESYFSNFLESRLVNVNSQFFGNYNGIFRIKKRMSIKLNLYAIHDRITNNQFIKNTYSLADSSFVTSDAISIKKKPTQYRADVEIKYNTSKNSLLEYKARIRQENIITPTFILQNQITPISLDLKTTDFFSKQELVFTQKLTKQKVLQLLVLNTHNSLPQQFTTSLSFTDSVSENKQESKFIRNHTTAKITLLGARKEDRYAFELGIRNENTPYFSLLNSTTHQTIVPISENDFGYNRFKIYQLGAYHFRWHRFKISPTYSLSYLWQNLDYQNTENLNLEAQNILLEPALSVKYKLNEVSSLSGKVGYNLEPNEENHFFRNDVLATSRLLRSNIPNLSLTNRFSYSLFYFNNNLSKQFDMQLGIFHNRNEGGFFNQVELSPTLIRNTAFFLNVPTASTTLNFKVGKYIDWINSTLRVDADYSRFSYNNIVNASELRNNQTNNFHSNIFLKTHFDIAINFENTFDISQNRSQNEESDTEFINTSLKHKFKILIQPTQKWFMYLTSEYFLPNLDQLENNYWFLSGNIRFRPKNKKWQYHLSAKNLLNIQNFEQIQVNDFSSSLYQSSILPRHFLIQGSYNF
ncbi:MAG: hypothetical protein COZ18_07620 [Flexibacter sp. CG_4_10_14_3_um_filter_32_15]|nr:MAG: hypothetical protein COZ18_07620 [Flexibacter sp. CG_4_10_14_3_um_filter_32_15]